MSTDRMQPSIPQGSLLFFETVEAESLQIGDIVSFIIQDNSSTINIAQDEPYEVSRIFGVIDASDELIFRTKSDAYDRLDFEFVKEYEIHGRITDHIPYFGFIVDNSNRFVSKLLLITPLIIIPVIIILLNRHKFIKTSS
jgi:signal peptidase I